MENKKTTINVNGEEIDVDFETMDAEEAEKMGIYIKKDKESKDAQARRKAKKIKNKIMGVVPLLALMAFFLLGFLADAWSWCWLVFLAIPIFAIILNISSKNLKGQIYSMITLAVIASILVIGFTIPGGWSWSWVLIFIIPIVSIIIEA